MAAAAARRERCSPGPAPRLISPQPAAPGAPPPGGAAAARAATQVRGLRAAPATPHRLQRAAQHRAPADHARVRARAGAGAAAATPQVWHPPGTPPAPVPAPARVGEPVSWRVLRAQAPEPRPAPAPPLAPPRPTQGPLAKGRGPTAAAARARRVPVGSAALPASRRALRATSGSDAGRAAEPQAPPATKRQGAGGRQRDVRADAALARPRGLPRGPTPAGRWKMPGLARAPWWPGPRRRPRARPAPGLPARARALARGEPLAPGEVWAGKWARSAHAFWVAPEPAAAAAGSAPR